MRILVLSDLHLTPRLITDLDLGEFPDHDVVVLAGDVWAPIGMSMAWASTAFERPVVLVAGNHEYYGEDLGIAQAWAFATPVPDVHWLEARQVVIGDVRFLGCTLWTDFRLFGDAMRVPALRNAKWRLNDFRQIKMGDGHLLTPSDTTRIHKASVDWLRHSLQASHDGPTVVVTHHAPSRRSVAPRYREDLLSAAFASDLDDLVESSGAAAWIHGHVHTHLDYRIGNTRVVCNPFGYGQEETGYVSSMVVEV